MTSNPPFTFLVQDVFQDLPEVRRYAFDYWLTPFEYYGGQFAVLTLPGSNPPLTAAVNICTSPLRRNCFEIAIKNTGGFGSKFYEEVDIGTVVQMQPPMGKFHLDPNETGSVILVAYDYCVTAIRAIWQYHQDAAMKCPLTLLHPFRGKANALFRDEFASSEARGRYYQPVELPENPLTVVGSKLIADVANASGKAKILIAGEGIDVLQVKAEFLAAGATEDRIRIERWS